MSWRSLLMAAISVAVTIDCANAAVFKFSFDSTTITNNTSTPKGNSFVQTYMQSILPGITVTGSGGLSNGNYTGDGHVVGPVNSRTVTPITLGNTGIPNPSVLDSPLPTAISPDGYIVNSGSDRITMYFPVPIYGVSFDYEIFPDGTCPSSTNCGSNQSNWPDFEFWADGVQEFVTVGALPSSGSYPHSPASGTINNERAPQYLGTSGWLSLNGATKLEFVDWPQRIGVDDLSVSTVPEPATLALLGIGLAGLGFSRRRKLH
jgi:hypothetical protein